MLLVCAACGKLRPNQGDVSGGPGPTVAIGPAAVGGARDEAGSSGIPANGGAAGGAGGAACLPLSAGAACNACESRKCTTNTFIYGDGLDATTYDPGTDPDPQGEGFDWYHLCYNATGTIADGPAKGMKKSDVCVQILKCVHDSGCNASDTANLPCYCGTGVTGDQCASADFQPKGPCKDVISWGAESTTALTIANRALDPSYAAGAALGLVAHCDYPNLPSWPTAPCQTECLGGADAGTTTCAATTTDAGAAPDGGVSHPDAGGDGGARGHPGTAGAGGGRGGSGAGGSAGGGSPGGCVGPYSFADPVACASCELGASTPDSLVPPTLLSAKISVDDNGNSTPEGFGPDSLATSAQRDAAFAIIHRALELKCTSDSTVRYRPGDMPGCETLAAHPCVYPALGCLLDVGQNPSDVLSGAFGTMTQYSALPEYRAAAIADATAGPAGPDPSVGPGYDGPGYGAPGGVASDVSSSALGSYIAAQSSNPASAIGMADNVLMWALNAGCTACLRLTAAGCGSGAGGAAGGAAGSNGPGGAGGALGSGGTGGALGSGGRGGALGSGGRGGAGAGGTISTGGTAGNAGAAGGVCPDLDKNGVPDCRETLVQNAGFDSAAIGWTAEPATTRAWTSLDGTGNSASGAVSIVNSDTNPADAPYGNVAAGAFQCIPVTVGACYQVDVQASISAAQNSVSAGFVLEEHVTSDCSQPVATSYISSQASGSEGWQTISGTTTQVPIGIASMAVRLVVVEPLAQGSGEALFDNVLVRATPCSTR
ncbi:MAG: hypothetical protein ABUS79_11495 [Pseudomonadota bacterium]